MTELLLKAFVKDYKNTENSAVRAKCGALSGWVGIFCNIFLPGTRDFFSSIMTT